MQAAETMRQGGDRQGAEKDRDIRAVGPFRTAFAVFCFLEKETLTNLRPVCYYAYGRAAANR